MVEQTFIIALGVFFLHATTWEGMFNGWVNRVAFNWKPWLKKPVFECPVCMVPWWGSLIYLTGGLPLPDDSLFKAALVLCAAGGLNAVLIGFIPFGTEED